MNATAPTFHADIGIGRTTARIHCADHGFLESLGTRYAGFLAPTASPDFEFDLHLAQPDPDTIDEDVTVSRVDGRWCVRRGDFHAEWDPDARRGWIRQPPNPYSLDSVLRIVHTLLLAGTGGMLVHSSSAVRNGRAYLFAGVSGAGKTTISRLAPADVQLLTDEMSYVSREDGGYFAYGTPFAGDLARPGENVRAPLGGIFLLRQGLENRIDPVGDADAVRGLLANILFFAHDPALVNAVFADAIELAAHVPVRRLTFLPDARVWDLIGD